MTFPDVPLVAQAAAFTLGCALVHASRRHPQRITFALSTVAFVLFLVLLVAIIPAYVLEQESDAEAGSSAASSFE